MFLRNAIRKELQCARKWRRKEQSAVQNPVRIVTHLKQNKKQTHIHNCICILYNNIISVVF